MKERLSRIGHFGRNQNKVKTKNLKTQRDEAANQNQDQNLETQR